MNKYQEALIIFCEQNTFKDIPKEILEDKYQILKELVDKETPMKPIIIPYDKNKNVLVFECPKCKRRTHTNFPRDYCGECGQAIDWSGE